MGSIWGSLWDVVGKVLRPSGVFVTGDAGVGASQSGVDLLVAAPRRGLGCKTLGSRQAGGNEGHVGRCFLRVRTFQQ
jgi:hypothetical protein